MAKHESFTKEVIELGERQRIKMNLPQSMTCPPRKRNGREAKLKKLYDIPLSEIDDFPDHPYRVLADDEDMQALMDSISERGVITPAMVAKENGRYEVISGHNANAPPARSSVLKPCAARSWT